MDPEVQKKNPEKSPKTEQKQKNKYGSEQSPKKQTPKKQMPKKQEPNQNKEKGEGSKSKDSNGQKSNEYICLS